MIPSRLVVRAGTGSDWRWSTRPGVLVRLVVQTTVAGLIHDETVDGELIVDGRLIQAFWRQQLSTVAKGSKAHA